jgi:hypothetical protein
MVRLVLPAWTGLLVIGGAGGVLTVDRASTAGSAKPARPTTTGATTTVPAPNETVSTTALATTAAPPPPGPAAAETTPPAAGSYSYRETSTGPDGKPGERDRTTTTTRVGQDGDALVQHVTVSVSTGSGEATARATVRWGPQGVITTEWVVRLYGGSFTCDWQTDVVQYPAHLAVGVAWVVNSTCAGKVQGGQLDGTDAAMRMKGTRKVTGTVVEQSPRPVGTWTVAAVSDLELTAAGLGAVTHTDGTEQYAPSLGVPTSSQATVTVDSFGQKRTSKTTSLLVTLPS